MKVRVALTVDTLCGILIERCMGRVCLIVLTLLGISSCWGAAADNQPSPESPLESLDCIRVPPGFRVEIVAAEPLIESPVAFEWGADGKLWVVEMQDYPNEDPDSTQRRKDTARQAATKKEKEGNAARCG
jgi:hypothetical protein